MEKDRCIAIGINRYHFLQPLSYAQADAQAIQQFWLEQTQLPPAQSLLLTETSAGVEGKSTYPNRETILSWLSLSQIEGKNGANAYPPFPSVLWFFFSGYGVNYQGEDYLMPIDGNPRDIAGTGIGLRSLFALLHRQGAAQVVAILDLNRSPGVLGGRGVGQQAIALAEEMGIALVLASQPEQFSYEADSLGQGLFTAAFLETLRQGGRELSLAALESDLSDRLAELSEHHWRPVQTPVILTPATAISQQPLLPAVRRTHSQPANPPQPQSAITFVPLECLNGTQGLVPQSLNSGLPVTLLPTAESKPQLAELEEFSPAVPTAELNSAVQEQIQVREAQRLSEATVIPAGKSGSRLWWFLAGGSVALFLAIFIPKFFSFNQPSQRSTPAVSTPAVTEDSAPSSAEATASPTPETVVPSPPPTTPAPTDVNRDLLNQARSDLQNNQVSSFTEAIEQARKIAPDNPLYSEAQGDIARWSRVILDIAQGRAKQEDFAGAIAAAQQVPADQGLVYAQAQQAIAQWQAQVQQQQVNQALIEAAKALTDRQQASAYNQAITTLRQIAPGEPGYGVAQQLILDWSAQIYLIAESQAAGGDFPQAMETAMLVPADSPSYKLAEAAIAKWKQGIR